MRQKNCTNVYRLILHVSVKVDKIFFYKTIIIPYTLTPFDICTLHPFFWKLLKFYSIFIFIISNTILLNILYNKLFPNNNIESNKQIPITYNNSNLNLLIGLDSTTRFPIYLCEKSLFQNILVTGTIGSGKTASAIYPFLEQLISYKSNNINEKLGMLILDVKGNYYKQVY